MHSNDSAAKEDALQRALDAVNMKKMTRNEAAKLFNVPRSTLYDRARGKPPRAKSQAASQLLTPAQVRGQGFTLDANDGN
jgi:predicted transcriptional regulator